MSSTGLKFECKHDFHVGERLEVSILWPVKLGDKCDLKLYVAGRVVRLEGTRTVMTIEKTEFRTAGKTFSEHSGAA